MPEENLKTFIGNLFTAMTSRPTSLVVTSSTPDITVTSSSKCPPGNSIESPLLDEDSSVLSSSSSSDDKLSTCCCHDNGPTTSDVTTPGGEAPALLPLSPRLPPKLEDRRSSDEESSEARVKLVRHKKKFNPFRSKARAMCAQSSVKSPSYPSSVTSEYHSSSGDCLSDYATVRTHLRKILPKSLRRRSHPRSKSLEPPRLLRKSISGGDVSLATSSSSAPNFPAPIPEDFREIINVSGRKFEVDSRALDEHPDTLLGNRERRMRFYDARRDEVFLDRHRGSFDGILDFYEKDAILRRPEDVPLEIFIEELKFYSFDRNSLEEFLRAEEILHVDKVKVLPQGKLKRKVWRLFEDGDSSCCAKVVTFISALVITLSVVVFCLETLPNFESLSHNVTAEIRPAVLECRHAFASPTRHQLMTSQTQVPVLGLYNFSEVFAALADAAQRCSSAKTRLSLLHRYAIARCYLELYDVIHDLRNMLGNCTVTPFAFATSSVVTSSKHRVRHETADSFMTSSMSLSMTSASKDDVITQWQVFELMDQMCPLLDVVSKRSQYSWFVLEADMGSPAGILFLTETACIVWFLTELMCRFSSCPDKRVFFKNFLNVIDLVAILPYFITLIVTTIETKTHLRPQTATILRTIRLIRMLRILKLSRYSRGFRILGLTLVRSTRVLFLLVCFQMVLAVVFSSIVFFVEVDAPGSMFKSIPDSFWWAIITMTTVGYGDVAPVTLWGKIAGACCAILGILCISFPVPVIVSNFNYLYNQDKDTSKLLPEDLMRSPEEDQDYIYIEDDRHPLLKDETMNGETNIREFASTSLCEQQRSPQPSRNCKCQPKIEETHERRLSATLQKKCVRVTVV